jgi:hypothetical protein
MDMSRSRAMLTKPPGLCHSQWFERMNGIAEGNTVHRRFSSSWNYEGIKRKRDLNPPMRYFDVWEMSVKRPDAHQKPPQDCLHMCQIGVMNYWQQVRPPRRAIGDLDRQLIFRVSFAVVVEHDRPGIAACA